MERAEGCFHFYSPLAYSQDGFECDFIYISLYLRHVMLTAKQKAKQLQARENISASPQVCLSVDCSID